MRRLPLAAIAALLTLAFVTVSVTSVLRARCLLAACCQQCEDDAPAIGVAGCDRVAPAAPAGLDRELQEQALAAPVSSSSIQIASVAPAANILGPRPSSTLLAAAYPPGGLALRL